MHLSGGVWASFLFAMNLGYEAWSLIYFLQNKALITNNIMCFKMQCYYSKLKMRDSSAYFRQCLFITNMQIFYGKFDLKGTVMQII